MPPIDWSVLFSTAPNIVTAVAFGFFVIKLLDRQDRQNDKRDAEWRAFLTDARNQYTASVNSVGAELNLLSTSFRETHSLLFQHDTWERSEMVREHAERAAAITAAAEAVKLAAQVSAAAMAKAGKE